MQLAVKEFKSDIQKLLVEISIWYLLILYINIKVDNWWSLYISTWDITCLYLKNSTILLGINIQWLLVVFIYQSLLCRLFLIYWTFSPISFNRYDGFGKAKHYTKGGPPVCFVEFKVSNSFDMLILHVLIIVGFNTILILSVMFTIETNCNCHFESKIFRLFNLEGPSIKIESQQLSNNCSNLSSWMSLIIHTVRVFK